MTDLNSISAFLLTVSEYPPIVKVNPSGEVECRIITDDGDEMVNLNNCSPEIENIFRDLIDDLYDLPLYDANNEIIFTYRGKRHLVQQHATLA